jgi:protein-disulfide isomerase
MKERTMELAIPVTIHDHVDGPSNAPVTLVEYGDFQCPYCGAAYGELKQVRASLGDALRFVFRHMPLVAIHPMAELAAEAAEAAGAQGRFWPMHDALYENQRQLSPALVTALATRLGLDMARFTADLRSRRHAEKIRQDIAGAERSGVQGTPAFFIDGRHYDGPYDAETLTEALQAVAGTRAA